MIDLSALPVPTIIEPLDYETILAEQKAELIALDPTLAGVLAVESEPVTKLIQVTSYRELLLRQRDNDAVKALLRAYATGSDLDHIGVTYYDVERLLIDPGDPNAVPPIDPTYESDERYRERCTLSLYARSTAGPSGAYKYHTKTASALVKDVKPVKHTPAPGDITIYLLSTVGDGTPDQALLDTVQAALDDEAVRPMNDTVFVVAADVVNYTIDASLIVYPDANTTMVLEQATAAAQKFADDHHALGDSITIALLDAALAVPGVADVVYTSPVGGVPITNSQAPYCTAINIVIGGTV